MAADVDVLVVGLGPVGAALCNLLGIHGVRVCVIDQAADIHMAPRAIALDNEALRVLQMCGLEDGDFDKVPIPEVRMHSPVLGQFSRAITAGAIDAHPKLVTFYQPQLERALRAQLARHASVQIRLQTSLLDFTAQGDQVEARLEDAQGRHSVLRARYLVGADGARSLVRRLLGLDFKGRTYAEDWLVVDALDAPVPIDHVEFVCDPARPTPHMVAPGGRQRWEFKLHPGEDPEKMTAPDTVRRLLAPWTQQTTVNIERAAVYRFHARVADSFQRDRVFLVGDAAHITPPFVGQGLVAGLRDVANLAWKLAWVLQGRAAPHLLLSYTQERLPHARRMIGLARFMGGLVMPRNRAMALLVHGSMRLISRTPRLRQLVEQLEIKPANRFDQGCFVGRCRASRLPRGGVLPQAWVRSRADGRVCRSDESLGAGLSLVGFGVDPRRGLPAELQTRWARAGGSFTQWQVCGTEASGTDPSAWEDFAGQLVPAAAPVGWVAVVRPDRTVMHDGPATAAADLLTRALSLLGVPAAGVPLPPSSSSMALPA